MGYFKFTASAKDLLFKGITFNSAGATFGICALVFVMSVAFEKLKIQIASLRSTASVLALRQDQPCRSEDELQLPRCGPVNKILLKRKALETLLYMVQMTMAYILMLIVMEYNLNYLIATALGFGLGHHVFRVK